jgi:hypothetical protein
MRLRRFRNRDATIDVTLSLVSRRRRRKNSALIFEVFVQRAECRLMVFATL